MASPAACATAPVSAQLVPLAVLLLAAHPARGETGLLRDVVFTDYTPLSSNLELARRLLTPLAAATLPERVAGSGKRLAEQPIELSEERFIVYVPAAPPRQGYGLLAFVPPWPEGGPIRKRCERARPPRAAGAARCSQPHAALSGRPGARLCRGLLGRSARGDASRARLSGSLSGSDTQCRERPDRRRGDSPAAEGSVHALSELDAYRLCHRRAGRSSCQRRFREHAVDAALVCLRPGELHDAFRRSHRRRRRGAVTGTGGAAGANADRPGQARALPVDDRVRAREEPPAGGSAHCRGPRHRGGDAAAPARRALRGHRGAAPPRARPARHE